jgi:hypothetical protein
VFAKKVLSCLSHTPSPFCFGYFGDGGLENYLFGLATNLNPPISASQVAHITSVNHGAWLILRLLMRSLVKNDKDNSKIHKHLENLSNNIFQIMKA